MKLEHLEYFCQIVPGFSLNALSEQIHISQQNLSTVIKLLETELSCKLLEKRGRDGVYFTAEGEAFFNATKKYLNTIQEIKFKANQVTGSLIIAARPGLINNHFAPIIDKYMKENPDVNLKFLYSSSSMRNLTCLANNEVELVLDNFLLDENNNIYDYYKPILDNYNFISCGQGVLSIQCHKYFFKNNNIPSAFYIKDLSDFPCITFTNSSDADFFLKSPEGYLFLKRYSNSSSLSFETNKDLYYLRLLNTNCYGLALLSREELNLEPYNNLINVLPKDPHISQYCIIMKKQALSPAAQRFVETLSHFYYI